MRSAKTNTFSGWQVKGRFDWFFMVASLIVFLSLEAILLYSYFHFINTFRP